MPSSTGSEIGLADPDEAYEALGESGAVLIDVRTREEWTFVGAPDLPKGKGPLFLIEWARLPDMRPDPEFVDRAFEAIAESGAQRAYFLCRSGARSHHAALATQQRLDESGAQVRCFNVLEGFEGDPDGDGRRGLTNGWKARGLPWRQS
jgi:rhodanese-related sulfurtransferase